MLSRIGRKSLATELRHWLYIQTASRARDGEGGFTTTWASGSSMVCAGIYPLKAKQVFDYKSVDVNATHLIKLRGKVTINDEQRFYDPLNGRIFEILYVEDIQEREIVKYCTCIERRYSEATTTTTAAP